MEAFKWTAEDLDLLQTSSPKVAQTEYSVGLRSGEDDGHCTLILRRRVRQCSSLLNFYQSSYQVLGGVGFEKHSQII